MTKISKNQKDIQILLAQNNLELSKEYLAIAKFNQQYKKSYRGIIDLAYNAAELCAKGCLCLKLQKSPATHKGVIQKFSEFYVKTDILEREVGKKLARGLRYRNLARYEKEINIGKEQADEILELAIILQRFLRQLFRVEKIKNI